MRAPKRGDWVTLALSEGQCEAINRRRHDARQRQSEPSADQHTGFMAHTGNFVKPGELVPMLIIRVWQSNHDQPGDWLVNGQAFLDGNDVLWVTSARQGDGAGEFRYDEPLRYEGDGP